METKHTPGQWKALDGDGFGFPIFTAGGDPQVELFVARAPREANARFIATAPDLLKKAEAFIADFKEYWEGGSTSLDELEAIIAKAKGESC